MLENGILQLRSILQTTISTAALFIYIIYTYLEAAIHILLPKTPKSLAGEIILITGAGNGIGRQICLQLIKSDAILVCWDKDKESNDSIVQDLKKQGVFAHGFTVDVSDRSQVEVIAEQVKKDVGDVSIIVNNSAIAPCHEFLECTSELVEDVFKINVLSHFWILRKFLPQMIKMSKGHIVTMCSIAGLKANRYMVPYHSSKAAIHGYVESLKCEIRHHPEKPDIQFTTVYPTAVSTRLMDEVDCKFRFPTFTPILSPEYVAKKLVDGMRRDEEFIYCPPSIPLFLFLEQFIPSKARSAVTDYLMTTFEPVSKSKSKAL